ncbi:MAG: aquaporin, partial [bacterium]
MVKSALLEFLGSFAITFFGAFSRVVNSDHMQLSVALSYFFLVSAFTYAFVHISGAQFNPFLTLSLVLSKKIVAVKG